MRRRPLSLPFKEIFLFVFLFSSSSSFAKSFLTQEEALRLANVRYNAGTATQLDVLTSQVALTEARLNQLLSYYGYNVALATMKPGMELSEAMARAGEFLASAARELAARIQT